MKKIAMLFAASFISVCTWAQSTDANQSKATGMSYAVELGTAISTSTPTVDAYGYARYGFSEYFQLGVGAGVRNFITDEIRSYGTVLGEFRYLYPTKSVTPYMSWGGGYTFDMGVLLKTQVGVKIPVGKRNFTFAGGFDFQDMAKGYFDILPERAPAPGELPNPDHHLSRSMATISLGYEF